MVLLCANMALSAILLSEAVWFRRNELVALDLVITAVSTMFAFVAMIGVAPSGWCSFSSAADNDSFCFGM